MPDTKDQSKTNKVADTINSIRSIQNDLTYLSFYGEKKLFDQSLERLVSKYRDLYSLDNAK